MTDPVIRAFANVGPGPRQISMDVPWLRGHIGYDPQLLLPPSCFTCRRCGIYGCLLGGPGDTKGICPTCCPIGNEEHAFEFEGGAFGMGWHCRDCGTAPAADYFDPIGEDR